MSTPKEIQEEKVRILVDKGLMNEWEISWPKFKVYVDKEINNATPNYTNVKSLHHSHWRKIFVDMQGNYSYEWWIELEKVIENVIEELQKMGNGNNHNNESTKFLKKQSFNNSFLANGHNTDTIRFSISKFQDTIIPLLYKHAYNLKLRVSFKLHYNWNKCLEAFKSGDIDVALHNFPTVLAYMKEMKEETGMFFFPFFTFYGYAIFVRKITIEQFARTNGCEKRIIDWKNVYVKKFLETNEILLERKSDMEWVFKKFCGKYGCDWSKVEPNIIDCDINSGKTKFLNEGSIALYCTNSMHIADLKKHGDKFEVIAKGRELTSHQNYNGLICKMEYLNEHPEIIKELIEIWFNNIAHFKEEWILIADMNDENGFENFHMIALLERLNTHTDSNVTMEDFIESYRRFNYFFLTTEDALNSFITNVLEKTQMLKNNFEISKIQSGGSHEEIDDQLIIKIRQQMNDAKKLLNL